MVMNANGCEPRHLKIYSTVWSSEVHFGTEVACSPPAPPSTSSPTPTGSRPQSCRRSRRTNASPYLPRSPTATRCAGFSSPEPPVSPVLVRVRSARLLLALKEQQPPQSSARLGDLAERKLR